MNGLIRARRFSVAVSMAVDTAGRVITRCIDIIGLRRGKNGCIRRSARKRSMSTLAS